MFKQRTQRMVFMLIMLTWFGIADASMFHKMSTQQLTQASDQIVIGTVAQSWSSWDGEKRMAYTYVKLLVGERIKGQAPKELLVRTPGGRYGNHIIKVHGVSSFQKGEKTLVFLQRNATGTPILTSLPQSKYVITKDPKTGEDMAFHHTPDGARWVDKHSLATEPRHGLKGGAHHAIANRATRQSLKAFVSEIRSHILSETAGQ